MKNWMLLAAALMVGVATVARAEDATDTNQIKALEGTYAAAIQAKDVDRLITIYQNSPELVVFDMIPPRQYTGWDAYRKDWQGALGGCKDAPKLELTDLAIDGDQHFAYGRNIQHMTCTTPNGGKMDVTFRVTDAYKKIGGKWLIVHEHISVPVDMETGKADMNSKP